MGGGGWIFVENALAKSGKCCRSHACRSRVFLFFVVSGQNLRTGHLDKCFDGECRLGTRIIVTLLCDSLIFRCFFEFDFKSDLTLLNLTQFSLFWVFEADKTRREGFGD